MLSANRYLSLVLCVLFLTFTLIVKGKRWTFFLMLVYIIFAVTTGLVIKERKAFIEGIELIPGEIYGKVVKLYRDGFDVETEQGKIRIYIARDQIFKYSLFQAVGGSRIAENIPYFKSEVESLAEIDDLVLYENVQLRRVGNFKKAEKVWEIARGRIGNCTARIEAGGKSKLLRESAFEKESTPGAWNKWKVDAGYEAGVGTEYIKNVLFDLSSCIQNTVSGLERYFFNKLKRNLTPSTYFLAKAVITGNSSYLPRSEEEWFRICGLMHVIAVSGTHITVIFGSILVLFRFLRLRKSLAVVSGILFSLVVVLFSGISPSALRAWLVFIFAIIAFYYSRGSKLKDLTHFSYFFLLLVDPLMIFDISLILSFAAVFALSYIYPVLKEISCPTDNLAIAEESLLVLWSVQLAVNPVLAFAFKEMPLTSSIANLIVVPLMSLFLVLVIVSGFLPEGILLKLNSLILNLLSAFAINASRLFSYLPCSSIRINGYAALALSFSLLGMMLVLRIRRFKLNLKLIFKALIVIFFVLIAINSFSKFVFERERIIFLEVGEGDASLLTSPTASILFDTGPPCSSLVEKLVRFQKTNLSQVFLSHYHVDHVGGLAELLLDENICIGVVFLPGKEGGEKEEIVGAIKVALKRRKIPFILINSKTNDIVINSFKIEVFGKDTSIKSLEANEDCLAFGVHTKELSCLLLADMPADIQKIAIPEERDFNIITVAHHGSEDGFSEEFFREKKPELAVISCGKNIYGHPSRKIVRCLKKLKIPYLITQVEGDVVVSE